MLLTVATPEAPADRPPSSERSHSICCVPWSGRQGEHAPSGVSRRRRQHHFRIAASRNRPLVGGRKTALLLPSMCWGRLVATILAWLVP
jgi:hypothetical protein